MEFVLAECVAVLGDRVHDVERADDVGALCHGPGVVFIFKKSGTPRIALRRLVRLLATVDVDRRLTLTLVRIAGAGALLRRPEVAGLYSEEGVIFWVGAGQVQSATSVIGISDDEWIRHTRALLDYPGVRPDSSASSDQI